MRHGLLFDANIFRFESGFFPVGGGLYLVNVIDDFVVDVSAV